MKFSEIYIVFGEILNRENVGLKVSICIEDQSKKLLIPTLVQTAFKIVSLGGINALEEFYNVQ